MYVLRMSLSVHPFIRSIASYKGIKIMDRIWVGTLDNLYPTAGNPWIGILALVFAVVFLYKVGLGNIGCCLGCYELSIFFLLVVCFGWSFCERAGESLRHSACMCVCTCDHFVVKTHSDACPKRHVFGFGRGTSRCTQHHIDIRCVIACFFRDCRVR